MEPAIAVVIPCLNEQATIGKVVDDFRRVLPAAEVHVLDNASTDRTPRIAAEHGASVKRVNVRGKGNVVARMMETVPADILILVDGDDTYPAEAARELLAPILADEADMVVGTRLQIYSGKAFRRMHVLGNRLVRGLINTIFHCKLTDIMSGYRVFTAELARNVPLTSVGFEVETELTLQTLYHGFVIKEVPIEYRQRPPGSLSKLRTFRDGLRVLWTIFNIFRLVKPLTFFGSLAILLLAMGILCAAPAIVEYLQHGKVFRFPLLFVGVGLVILSFGSVGMGVVLHAMNVRLKEVVLLMRKLGGPRGRS